METQTQPSSLDALAERLTAARLNAKPIPQLSRDIKFSRADAYSIQEIGQKHRLERGEELIGYKMGLTSKAKREQMNLDAPLYGVLTDTMALHDGGEFSLKGSIHPKIEPEVAFLLSQDLQGKKTREEILNATSAVCACLEILDSRYEQFKYFSMEDVIADNSSSSHFVMGAWLEEFHDLDLKNLSMDFSCDGETFKKGNTQDISGDPVVSVMQLLELLELRGLGLKAGMIVLAGAATEALALSAGQKIHLEVEGLSPLSLTIQS
jgi:2-oxo-3-hexenedioate decarboxylase